MGALPIPHGIKLVNTTEHDEYHPFLRSIVVELRNFVHEMLNEETAYDVESAMKMIEMNWNHENPEPKYLVATKFFFSGENPDDRFAPSTIVVWVGEPKNAPIWSRRR